MRGARPPRVRVGGSVASAMQGRCCPSEDASRVDGIIEAMACDARSTAFPRPPSQAPQVLRRGEPRGQR